MSAPTDRSPSVRDVALIAVLSSLGPFAANAYVPAFGEIAAAFSADMVAVQQTLSAYLVAFAVASLFIGAASDAFGRKAALGASFLVFATASVGAMLSGSVSELFCWRLLMGVCAAAGPVVTQAIVRDRWHGIAAARVIGLIAIIFGVAPALSPIIGGHLTVWFGWRSVFVFLALLSLFMGLAALLLLPETLPRERRVSFRPAATLARYGRALRLPAFTAGVIGNGFVFLGLIVFSAGAADYVLHVLGLGIDEFGWLMVPLVAAGMLGSWLSPRLLERWSQARILFTGLGVLIVSGLFGVLCDSGPFAVFPGVLLAPVVYNLAAAAIRPPMNVMNLDYFPRGRGLAASVQQFFQTGAFALDSAVVIPLVMGSAWKYDAVMLLSGIGALVCWLIVRRTRPAALAAAAEAEARSA